MNQRLSTILIIAVLISAGATYLIYRLIASKPASAATVQVIQAARTLELGTLIRDSDLKIGPWAGPVPPGMAVKKDDLIGRGVITPIYAGEAIMQSRLAPAGAGGGLAATIPAGMRACAVRVNDIVGVAGFVGPGMRVDVLISGNLPGAQNADGPQVKTLLQNIEVLSAGQNYQKDAEGKPVVVPVVNLLVTPEQAETLSLASNETRIQLVLRNPLDTQTAKVPGTAMANLFGAAPKVAAPPRPRPVMVAAKAPARVPAPALPDHRNSAAAVPLPPYQVEVITGSKRTEVQFARSADGEKE